jgi:acetyl esterase/lipase
MRIPDNIERKVNLSYGQHGKWNLLDVFYPRGTDKQLPTIINVHGGGYVYGTKDQSQYYCMNLAQHGFTVVSFSYHLVPKTRFPTPVMETNEVMKWVCKNATEYFIDLNNIFIVGDSAGAQIASQYCAIVTNTEYAELFGFTIPVFKLKATALNCGIYEKFHEISGPLPGLLKDYFGKDPLEHGEKINVLKYINEHYPPTFIMSAENDFLLPNARSMYEYLQKKGIESVCEIYGTKEQTEIGHVFHLNILSDIARMCNDAECNFFYKYVN